MRVLGIDTSLRSSGVGVVDAVGSKLAAVDVGVIRVPASAAHSRCLTMLESGLSELIAKTSPDAVAIEGAFYCKNVRTAMTLGEARGVAIATCSRHGLSVFEYAPRRVKQAVAGYGNASKEQLRQMVMRLLNLVDEPQEDAGDALAIAICHLNSRSGHEALAPKAL